MDTALAILRRDAATTFELNDSGRIVRENGPDGSPGPRAFIAGCAGGNLVHIHTDVTDDVAAEVANLVAREPPWTDPASQPACAGRVAQLLTASRAEVGLNYRLPTQAAPSGDFVCGDTPQGEALVSSFQLDGMPPHLAAAGFVSVADLWPPWCAVIEDSVVAALAFTARRGPASAAVGVYTFPGFRGRGLAAAVTARWTALPALANRTLFYGTSAANVSSQRVAARLRLRSVGLGLRLA